MVDCSPYAVWFCRADVGKIECNFLETLADSCIVVVFVEHAVTVVCCCCISEMGSSIHMASVVVEVVVVGTVCFVVHLYVDLYRGCR